MFRLAFKMTVKRGFEDEYKKRHNPIWTDLKKVFCDHGVKSYSIFKDPESNFLFAYVEVSDIKKWNQISNTKACREWWEYMKPVMLVNHDNSPVSVELEEVFYFAP